MALGFGKFTNLGWDSGSDPGLPSDPCWGAIGATIPQKVIQQSGLTPLVEGLGGSEQVMLH